MPSMGILKSFEKVFFGFVSNPFVVKKMPAKRWNFVIQFIPGHFERELSLRMCQFGRLANKMFQIHIHSYRSIGNGKPNLVFAKDFIAANPPHQIILCISLLFHWKCTFYFTTTIGWLLPGFQNHC